MQCLEVQCVTSRLTVDFLQAGIQVINLFSTKHRLCCRTYDKCSLGPSWRVGGGLINLYNFPVPASVLIKTSQFSVATGGSPDIGNWWAVG